MLTGEPFDPSLIVFAALAVFVIWKLRSVLGMRVDRDSPAPGRFEPRRPPPAEPAALPGAAPVDAPARAAGVQSPDRWKGLAEKDGPAWAGLDAIAAADARFDGESFVNGARRAYELIVTAFAKGDRDTLRGLLSKDVFDNFAGEITRRETAGDTMETAVVAIDAATIEAARAAPRNNEITVRFESRLMSVRRDSKGEPLEGGLDQTRKVVELWTFARDPRAADPTWRLVATEAV